MANTGRSYPYTRSSHSTVVKFDQPLAYIGADQEATIIDVTSNITLTVDETDKQVGGGELRLYRGDGTHTVDVSDFAITGPGSFDNTNGTINMLMVFWNGYQYCAVWTQPGTGGTGGGGGGGGATALNAPTGLVCDVISDTEIDLNWTDTNSSPNETSIKVYKNTVNNFGTATLHATLTADAVLTAVTGLTASTTYYFWVVAGGNGTTTSNSSPSTVASATTSASGGGGSEETLNFSITPSGMDPSVTYLKMADKHIASGADGYIQWQWSADNGYIGFAKSTTAFNGYDGSNTGLRFSHVAYVYSGTLTWLINGSGTAFDGVPQGVGSSSGIGTHLRLKRVGSTMKLYHGDGASSWTFVADIDTSSNVDGDLYIYEFITQTSEKGSGLS